MNRRKVETVIDYALMVLFLIVGASKIGLEQYDTAVWVFLSCVLLGVSIIKDKLLRSYEQQTDWLQDALIRVLDAKGVRK